MPKAKLTKPHNSGIGLETTILMLREGASVLMTDINESTLATALEKVNKIVPSSSRTGKVEIKAVDVSSESQIEAAIAHLDSWGGLDVIFNNAGIMHPKDGDAEECPEDIWDRTMNINVKGVWFGSKHAVRSFRKHGKKRASVINTASMVALVGAATPQLAYTASKGAVLAMTRELAIVHAREGFRFNSLCPAPLKYDSSPLSVGFSGTGALTVSIAHLCCRIGLVMTRRSASVGRFTSQADGSERLLSRRMRLYSLLVMRAASSTQPTLLLMAV
jgi:NAD(P)-dependent dehydrogenase (short-subunit alcohol dehydrogenase family)